MIRKLPRRTSVLFRIFHSRMDGKFTDSITSQSDSLEGAHARMQLIPGPLFSQQGLGLRLGIHILAGQTVSFLYYSKRHTPTY